MSTSTLSLRRLRRRSRSLWGGLGFREILGLLLLVVFGFHLLTFQEETWWGDSYQYFLHAANLLAGQAYAATGVIPSPYAQAPAAFPGGYPLLLAPLLSAFGVAPQAFAVLASLALLGAAWATATLARGWIPDPFALGLAALIALQPGLMALSRQPLSDLPFLFLVMLCLLAAERASYQSERWRSRAVVAGLALGAAILTQRVGLVLVPALLLPGLVRHRRLERPALVAVGLGGLVWLGVLLVSLTSPLWAGLATGIGSTQAEDASLLGQLVGYARSSFPLWRVGGPDILKNVFFVVALVPVALGLAHRIRRRFGPAEAFALLYVLTLLVWGSGGIRDLFPLYPIYYLYLMVGLWRLGRDSLRRQWAVNTALVAAVALSYGSRYLEWSVAGPTEILADADMAMYTAVREQTPEGSVLLSTLDPRFAVYHAERSTARGPSDSTAWSAFADNIGADHALVRDRHPIAPVLLRDERYRLLHREGDLSLYRRCPAACTADSTR